MERCIVGNVGLGHQQRLKEVYCVFIRPGHHIWPNAIFIMAITAISQRLIFYWLCSYRGRGHITFTTEVISLLSVCWDFEKPVVTLLDIGLSKFWGCREGFVGLIWNGLEARKLIEIFNTVFYGGKHGIYPRKTIFRRSNKKKCLEYSRYGASGYRFPV